MNIEFRQAVIDDFSEIVKLYAKVIKTTYTTWDKDYPSKAMIKEDIMTGRLVAAVCDNKIIGVAAVDGNKFEDEGMKVGGFARICIHPDYQGTFIDDDGYIEILKCAKDLDMIVITHSGIDDGYKDLPVKCPPELVKKVIEKVNHNKFVLGHYGAHKQWEQVLSLIAGRNVYLDTAYTLHEISQDLFVKIMDKHGDDKILFATDCPWRDIKDDLEILKSYNLNPSSEQKILYKNALKLLDIKE
jgi:predicted TIM-barrel fold metal-dependent hydrolase